MTNDLPSLAAREASRPEPAPMPGREDVAPHLLRRLLFNVDSPEVAYRLVQERAAFGRQKYGTPLQTHNGRDAVEDARQEAGDLMLYIQQAKMEGRDLATLRPLVRVLVAMVGDDE